MAKVIVTQNRAQAIVLNELLASKTSRRHTRMMTMAELHQRSALSRPHFEVAVIALAEANLIVLQQHDYPASVGERERAEFLKYRGVEFHAVNLRE